jgi:general secretion pathway protein D
MSARILTAYLVSLGLLAGIISQALAKPPDLPAKVHINCEKSSDKMVLKTYQVADLVVPVEGAPWPVGAPPTPAYIPVPPVPFSGVMPPPMPAPALLPPPAAPGPVPPPFGYLFPQLFDFATLPVTPPQMAYQPIPAMPILGSSHSREAGKATQPCCPACASGKCAACPLDSCCQVPDCNAAGCSACLANPAKKTMEDHLIRLIVNTVKPESWAVNGGRGTIEFFPMGMALTVHQTPEVQEMVASLLGGLQHLQDEQIAVEVRVIKVPQGFGEKVTSKVVSTSGHCNKPCCDILVNAAETKFGSIHLGAGVNTDAGISGCICVDDSNRCPECCSKECADSKSMSKLKFLSEEQVQKFMEGIQSHPKTNVMMAPKLTMLNGQTGNININEQQFFVTNVKRIRQGDQEILIPENQPFTIGHRFSVKPTVSADHQFIQMAFEMEEKSLDTPPGQVPLFPVTTFITPIKGDGTKCDSVPFTQFIQQPCLVAQRIHQEVCVPCGQTAFFKAFVNCEKLQDESGVPILSWLPYIGDLFKTVGYHEETADVWIMITPRLIVSQEEVRPPAAADAPHSVSDNLEKLNHARALIKQAEYYQRVEHPETARFYYELVGKLCPGSRYAQLADRHLKQLEPQHPPTVKCPAYEAPVHLSSKFTELMNRKISKRDQEVSEYLNLYWQACAERKPAEALHWAVQALALDVDCFAKVRDANLQKSPAKAPTPSAN